jgi:hypothetical protein
MNAERWSNISDIPHLNFPFDRGFQSSRISALRYPFEAKGCPMKKWSVVILAVALLMPIVAAAQHSSKAAEGRPAGSQASIVARKAVSIAGQISLDGKKLVSEENDVWSVINPDVLSAHKGQQVLVKCQVFPDKNEIHVLSVKPALLEVKTASNKADSAFKR